METSIERLHLQPENKGRREVADGDQGRLTRSIGRKEFGKLIDT